MPLATLAALAVTPGCSDSDTPRTRLVLISLDTLRADRFDPATMPALSAAAAEGLVFERFHAATSVTLPTHVSMLSGLHPWQHGALRNGVIVRDDITLLAERLHDAGFSTAAVVASFPLERRFRLDQGFDTYIDDFVQPSAKGSWNDEDVPDALFSSPADVIAEDALRLLDDATGDKQFFFFHFFDPHAPYGDSRPGKGTQPLELGDLLKKARNQSPGLAAAIERAETLYDADVTFLDTVLGRLLERLADDADRYETHVIITADHGESFGDDGSLGHGKRLSPAQVHVPLVLLSPRIAPGTRADVAGSVDLTPTLMALAGLPADNSLPGRDLLGPVPTQPRALGMRSLFDGEQRDIRTDGRALPVDALRFYIARAGSHVTGGPTGALDGEVTSAESAAITGLFADFAAEVRARMDEMVESADPETRAALEALGYTR